MHSQNKHITIDERKGPVRCRAAYAYGCSSSTRRLLLPTRRGRNVCSRKSCERSFVARGREVAGAVGVQRAARECSDAARGLPAPPPAALV
ncbi:hypothetical protein EVAR_27150_1 [Eumeta japonica]|uniref:Uncharacterized protein n=1 Tax=Eumeta variegata TaxID=151549 RepID=A0A4C1W098_EUMVA|nr:hypothetical protein EVAR_27150_1 [Eumeta japonica]